MAGTTTTDQEVSTGAAALAGNEPQGNKISLNKPFSAFGRKDNEVYSLFIDGEKKQGDVWKISDGSFVEIIGKGLGDFNQASLWIGESRELIKGPSIKVKPNSIKFFARLNSGTYSDGVLVKLELQREQSPNNDRQLEKSFLYYVETEEEKRKRKKPSTKEAGEEWEKQKLESLNPEELSASLEQNNKPSLETSQSAQVANKTSENKNLKKTASAANKADADSDIFDDDESEATTENQDEALTQTQGGDSSIEEVGSASNVSANVSEQTETTKASGEVSVQGRTASQTATASTVNAGAQTLTQASVSGSVGKTTSTNSASGSISASQTARVNTGGSKVAETINVGTAGKVGGVSSTSATQTTSVNANGSLQAEESSPQVAKVELKEQVQVSASLADSTQATVNVASQIQENTDASLKAEGKITSDSDKAVKVSKEKFQPTQTESLVGDKEDIKQQNNSAETVERASLQAKEDEAKPEVEKNQSVINRPKQAQSQIGKNQVLPNDGTKAQKDDKVNLAPPKGFEEIAGRLKESNREFGKSNKNSRPIGGISRNLGGGSSLGGQTETESKKDSAGSTGIASPLNQTQKSIDSATQVEPGDNNIDTKLPKENIESDEQNEGTVPERQKLEENAPVKDKEQSLNRDDADEEKEDADAESSASEEDFDNQGGPTPPPLPNIAALDLEIDTAVAGINLALNEFLLAWAVAAWTTIIGIPIGALAGDAIWIGRPLLNRIILRVSKPFLNTEALQKEEQKIVEKIKLNIGLKANIILLNLATIAIFGILFVGVVVTLKAVCSPIKIVEGLPSISTFQDICNAVNKIPGNLSDFYNSSK